MSSSESEGVGAALPPPKRQRRFAFKTFQQRVSEVRSVRRHVPSTLTESHARRPATMRRREHAVRYCHSIQARRSFVRAYIIVPLLHLDQAGPLHAATLAGTSRSWT